LFEHHVGAVRGDAVGFELGRSEEALLRELVRPAELALRTLRLFLGEVDRLARLLELEVALALQEERQVLLREVERLARLVDVALVLADLDLAALPGLDEIGLGAAGGDALLDALLDHRGRVELAHHVAFVHLRALGHEREDRGASLDAARQAYGIRRIQAAVRGDGDAQRTAANRRALDLGRRLARLRPGRHETQDDHRRHEHADDGERGRGDSARSS
jgi:hypothetical protein